MNIRYKVNGIAVKFNGENYEELYNLLNSQDRLHYENLEAYKAEALSRNNRPAVRLAGQEWLIIETGQYFVSIDGVDIAVNEQDFNENFESYE